LRNLILWSGLIIAPLLLLLLWDEAENLFENFRSHNTATQDPLHVEDANPPMFNMHHLMQEQKDGESSPRVYPYSVVDGGVHSVQELRSAIRRDPVVAKHYSNFKLERARVIEAKADRHFHVSYRMGDEIFWTKKRLKVAKGEKLITDGANSTRTRCANVLSEAPQGKTSLNEPTAEVLDTPTLFPSDPSPFMPPVVVAGGTPGPMGGSGGGVGDPDGEGVFPGLGPGFGPGALSGPGLLAGPGLLSGPGSGPESGPESGPGPVPEPTTLLLIGSGLAGLWGFRKKFKK
jgi:hypothetical protein